jgi:hypothetical protein
MLNFKKICDVKAKFRSKITTKTLSTADPNDQAAGNSYIAA